MDNWYYAWNGEKLGPVPLAELQRLVEEGTLEPTDLVWTKGMPEWQPAGKVAALGFSEEPPPLPDSQVIRHAIHGRWEEALPLGARWLWNHKAIFFFLAAALCGLTTAVLSEMRVPDVYVVTAMVPTVLFSWGLVIVGIVKLCQVASQSHRKSLLIQKWESTTGDGSWIQFSQDGGFVRNDGLGAKYTFDTANDRIELRPVDDSSTILVKVVLLSEKELAITWDGKTLHFQKPSWWKRVFG